MWYIYGYAYYVIQVLARPTAKKEICNFLRSFFFVHSEIYSQLSVRAVPIKNVHAYCRYILFCAFIPALRHKMISMIYLYRGCGIYTRVGSTALCASIIGIYTQIRNTYSFRLSKIMTCQVQVIHLFIQKSGKTHIQSSRFVYIKYKINKLGVCTYTRSTKINFQKKKIVFYE